MAKFIQNIVADHDVKKLPLGINGRNVCSVKSIEAKCIKLFFFL
jgi:hypothetical protein